MRFEILDTFRGEAAVAVAVTLTEKKKSLLPDVLAFPFSFILRLHRSSRWFPPRQTKAPVIFRTDVYRMRFGVPCRKLKRCRVAIPPSHSHVSTGKLVKTLYFCQELVGQIFVSCCSITFRPSHSHRGGVSSSSKTISARQSIGCCTIT